MIGYQGFKTKEEAKAFIKEHGGMLCENNGIHAHDYRNCVIAGGLDSKQFPFAVQWNIPSGNGWPSYPKDKQR